MKKRTNRKMKSKRFVAVLSVCVLLLSLFATTVSAAEPKSRTVKVGYMLMENFEEEEETQLVDEVITVRSGYAYDYFQMIRSYTGWDYEYVHGTWHGLLEQLERGEIDILSHVARTPERDEMFLFSTEPQGIETHYLYVDGPSEAIDADDYTTLNDKNIGVISGDFRTGLFLEWCEEQDIHCNIKEYRDIEEVHTALHSGEIHATSASRLTISSCKDGKWRAVIRFEDTPVYFAVKKNADGQALLDELNEAHSEILAINPNFGQELQQKYSHANVMEAPKLTVQEKVLLENRGKLILGYCDERRPLAYTDDQTGKISGLIADYLNAMTEQYGIQFETRSYKDGNELLAALKKKEVDIISPVGYHAGVAEAYQLALTNPITVETMIAVYKGYKGTEPKDIFEQIAILDTSMTEKDYAKRYYPNSEWVRAGSIGEAIDLVAEDRAGCYIIRSSTWAWYKNDYPVLNELQVLTLPESNDVNMAVRDEDVALISILNKGISLLTEADVTQSLVTYSDARDTVTWITLIKQNPITTVIGILASVLFVVLVFLFYRMQTEKQHMKKLQEANKRAEEARLEAERANQAKSTFLTSMSHDIRTPMNAIVGMTTLAAKHLNSPDYVRNCLGKVTLASDHLLTLINDVLDINKIESGNLSLTPCVFSLADSVMNLANIGRHQLQEKNHHFEIRIHNIKQEYLFADELRINQIFINLLSNAVKYTPANGRITIDVKQEEIAGERGKVRLIYAIQDSGIGMTEEFQAHMYELFVMANKNSRTVTGSGVGLAICKQLVDLMEGTIECESREGEGTRFTVTLEIPIAEKVVDELVLPPMKLLLVDDDEIFLATAAETLQELGLSPDCVDNGQDAIAVVKQKNSEGKDYPLIIIDWKMPQMDGIETTREIRKIVGPDVSIIVISAYAPEDIRDAAIAAGANGFINKPFFRTAAYQSISEILGLGADDKDELIGQHKKVKGMHVLVAEDNDLNWEIARELLAMYEVTSERAENGQVCLEMLEKAKPGQYDAVLMDIQMPVMDGYAAAREIRYNERSDIRNIPVVAMTADAYTEDVMLCAQAGMNFHVPKPIDMERLLEVLGDLRMN